MPLSIPSCICLSLPIGSVRLGFERWEPKLRRETRDQLLKLQRKLSTTTIYVTHDQSEAMTMSDRIAVMNNGKIVQTGSPAEIYDNPINYFVADFIGESNFIKGKNASSFGYDYG